MQAYHSFAREQRPLLSEGRSPGEREKLLSQRWKALSKAEKAHYKGCEGSTQTPSRLAYSAFCRVQRPFLPPTLPNAQREVVLGELWARLPERERAEYRVGGSRAPVPAPTPPTASALLGEDGSKNKRSKTAASMVAPSAPESTAVPLALLAPAAPLAPPTGSAPPFFALTAPSSASTSPTASSHSLSTDTNDDDYEWEKYLRLEDGFISSSLTSLDALHVQETSKVLMEQLYSCSMCVCMYLACVHADSYVMPVLHHPPVPFSHSYIYCCMPLAGDSALFWIGSRGAFSVAPSKGRRVLKRKRAEHLRDDGKLYAVGGPHVQTSHAARATLHAVPTRRRRRRRRPRPRRRRRCLSVLYVVAVWSQFCVHLFVNLALY